MRTYYTYARVAELVLKRADMENSRFVEEGSVTDGELYQCIHLAAEQHYHNLVSLREDLFVKEANVTTVADTAEYALAVDLLKLRAARLLINTERVPLHPFTATATTSTQSRSWGTSFLPRYQLRMKLNTGATDRVYHMLFDPPPSAVHTVVLEYIEEWIRATLQTEELRLPFPEWVILDAAQRLVTKEEGDPSGLVSEREMLGQRITAWATPADQNWPRFINDHRSNEEWDDWLYV